MKKINEIISVTNTNLRFRNLYFWLAISSVIYLIITDLGILNIQEERFQQYVELISTAMIISGIWVNPTTPGFTDGSKQDEVN